MASVRCQNHIVEPSWEVIGATTATPGMPSLRALHGWRFALAHFFTKRASGSAVMSRMPPRLSAACPSHCAALLSFLPLGPRRRSCSMSSQSLSRLMDLPNGLEICELAAPPPLVHIGHTATRGFLSVSRRGPSAWCRRTAPCRLPPATPLMKPLPAHTWADGLFPIAFCGVLLRSRAR